MKKRRKIIFVSLLAIFFLGECSYGTCEHGESSESGADLRLDQQAAPVQQVQAQQIQEQPVVSQNLFGNWLSSKFKEYYQSTMMLETQEKAFSNFTKKKYAEIYLELMKNADPNSAPVLRGTNFELFAITKIYQVRIKIIYLGISNQVAQSPFRVIGEQGPEITILTQGAFYKYIDSTGKLNDVPVDNNSMFNAIIEASKISGLSLIIPENIVELRSEIVEYLQSTCPNLYTTILNEDSKINEKYTLKEIVSNFLFMDKPLIEDLTCSIYVFGLFDKLKKLKQQEESFSILASILEIAEKGNAHAQCGLALFHEVGIGKKKIKNQEMANKWLVKAAEQGFVLAQSHLGCLYAKGLNGFTKNRQAAIEWFTKAADKGFAEAQYNLGLIYKGSKPGEMVLNYDKALEFFTKAANQDYKYAKFELGALYYATKQYPLAVKWFTKAANQGEVKSLCWLSTCYEYGQGVPINISKAIRYLTEAASKGDEEALIRLSVYYEEGIKVPKNFEKSLEYLMEGVKKGYISAQIELGQKYIDGRGGVQKNVAKGLELLIRVAEQNNADAQRRLGFLYTSGLNIPQDLAEGLKWTTMAAEQGNAIAQCDLGVTYECGRGVSVNYPLAIKWYLASAAQNNGQAKNFLISLQSKMNAAADPLNFNGFIIDSFSSSDTNQDSELSTF